MLKNGVRCQQFKKNLDKRNHLYHGTLRTSVHPDRDQTTKPDQIPKTLLPLHLYDAVRSYLSEVGRWSPLGEKQYAPFLQCRVEGNLCSRPENVKSLVSS